MSTVEERWPTWATPLVFFVLAVLWSWPAVLGQHIVGHHPDAPGTAWFLSSAARLGSGLLHDPLTGWPVGATYGRPDSFQPIPIGWLGAVRPGPPARLITVVGVTVPGHRSVGPAAPGRVRLVAPRGPHVCLLGTRGHGPSRRLSVPSDRPVGTAVCRGLAASHAARRTSARRGACRALVCAGPARHRLAGHRVRTVGTRPHGGGPRGARPDLAAQRWGCAVGRRARVSRLSMGVSRRRWGWLGSVGGCRVSHAGPRADASSDGPAHGVDRPARLHPVGHAAGGRHRPHGRRSAVGDPGCTVASAGRCGGGLPGALAGAGRPAAPGRTSSAGGRSVALGRGVGRAALSGSTHLGHAGVLRSGGRSRAERIQAASSAALGVLVLALCDAFVVPRLPIRQKRMWAAVLAYAAHTAGAGPLAQMPATPAWTWTTNFGCYYQTGHGRPIADLCIVSPGVTIPEWRSSVGDGPLAEWAAADGAGLQSLGSGRLPSIPA